jgi:hypothetical protein
MKRFILHFTFICKLQLYIVMLCADVYYDVKPTYTYEAQACNCVLPSTPGHKGCGEDCINRMVYSECSPQLCPCKELCSNQRIQRHEWAPGLEKFMTKDKVCCLESHILIHPLSVDRPKKSVNYHHFMQDSLCLATSHVKQKLRVSPSQ